MPSLVEFDDPVSLASPELDDSFASPDEVPVSFDSLEEVIAEVASRSAGAG